MLSKLLLLLRPVWASNMSTPTKTRVASSCHPCTTSTTGTFTSTWPPSSGKASGWSVVWVQAGSSICCVSSPSSPASFICCCRRWWRRCSRTTTRLRDTWICGLTAGSALLASQVLYINTNALSFSPEHYDALQLNCVPRCPLCSEGDHQPLQPRRRDLCGKYCRVQSLC